MVVARWRVVGERNGKKKQFLIEREIVGENEREGKDSASKKVRKERGGEETLNIRITANEESGRCGGRPLARGGGRRVGPRGEGWRRRGERGGKRSGVGEAEGRGDAKKGKRVNTRRGTSGAAQGRENAMAGGGSRKGKGRESRKEEG